MSSHFHRIVTGRGVSVHARTPARDRYRHQVQKDHPLMDTAESNRRLIEKILVDYAAVPYSQSDVRLQTVFDRVRDHNVLMLNGWEGVRRVHGCLVHVDIIDGKSWIQRDGTEYSIAQELLDAGIPRDHIVLEFRSLEMRRLTDLAIA
jgi:hypothetical protein